MSGALQTHFVATSSQVFALLTHVHLVLVLAKCAKLNFLWSTAYALKLEVFGNQGTVTHKEHTIGGIIFPSTNPLTLTRRVTA